MSQEVKNALIATKAQAVQIQRGQLFSGVKSDDTPITPPYAPATVKRKIAKGQPYDRVTGYDTGSMYAETFDTVYDDRIELYSRSVTAPLFTKRYGDTVWGLNTKSKSEYTPIAGKVYIDNVRKILKL